MDSPGGYEIFHSLENLHIHFGFQVRNYSQELEDFLSKNNDRSLYLRIGFWSANLKRKFRDINIKLCGCSIPSNIFTFCFNPKSQEHRELGNCILFVQFIDESGVPIAESTEKINLDSITAELNIPLIESIYLTGQSRKLQDNPQNRNSKEISSIMICNLSVFHYIGLQELDVSLLAEKWNVLEHIPKLAEAFPQLYLSSKGSRKISESLSFLTVQDVNLSEDILQLYKSRTLLVRAKITNSQSSWLKYAFLGFIRGDEAIWFEDVEIGNLQGCKLYVELFTVSKSAQINSRVVESELCHGEQDFSCVLSQSLSVSASRGIVSLDKNSNAIDGIFNVDLITNVAVNEGMHKDHSCVQVGQIIVKLFHDQSPLMPRSIHSTSSHPDDVISSIEALEFPEDDNLNQYGILFASTCKNLSYLWASNHSRIGNTKSNKKINATLATMGRLLSLLNRKNYFHEKNIHRWSAILLSSQVLDSSLKALRIYFEEWLVSDTLQLLIERSKDEVVVYSGTTTIAAFLQNEGKWLDDIAKSVFTLLLSRMTSILGKVSAFDQQASATSSIQDDSRHEDGHCETTEDNENLMTKIFIQDIATDLLTMLLIYRRKLTHEYLALRDTFIEPVMQLDQWFLDLSDRIQILSKFLFRILPHTEEINELIVRDCLLSESTMKLFLENHTHFDDSGRSQLLSLFKQHLLWQISSLGVVQVYFSGLARVQPELIPKCMENVRYIMEHVDLLTKLTAMKRQLHGESLNFFLCELISVLIACLTKVLGFEYDNRSAKLIAKKMNLDHFYTDIHEMSVSNDNVSFAAPSDEYQTSEIGSIPKTLSLLTATNNQKMNELTAKSMLARRILSMDDLPNNDLSPPSPIPNLMARSYVTTDGAATGSRLLRSIQDASPCFACLLKLFLLILQRSDVLNEQEQLTSTQLKTYLNSILFAVVNAKDFRPSAIKICLTTYFSGVQTNTTNEDIRQGLLSLVDLLCCIDKVYYCAMLKQVSRSQVDVAGLVKDMYLSLSFYIAFANMSQDRLTKAFLTGQELCGATNKKPASRLQLILATKQSLEVREEAQQRQLEERLMEDKRILRHRLLECIQIMMEEILTLLQQQLINSSVVDDTLLGCLESCTIVWKNVMGMNELPRLYRYIHGKNALRTLYSVSYLQEQFQKLWQLLLRMYSLSNAAMLEAYPAYAATRMQLTSMVISIIEVKVIDLIPSSVDPLKPTMQQEKDDETILSEENPSCAKWLSLTRNTMRQFFQDKLLHNLLSLSHNSAQSIVMICQEILELPSSPTSRSDNDAAKNCTTSILEEEIAVHALLVDLIDVLRWYHNQQETRTVLLHNTLLEDSLLLQVQELLLSMRAFAQVAHGYVPSSASFERPLCHHMMSIAGAIPMMLYTTQRNMKNRLRQQPQAYIVSLATMQRQLNSLKRLYTPMVRSRISRNKVIVLEEADVLKGDESRFDEDFSWENFMGKSEYAFVQVWQFLLYVNMNIARVIVMMNNSVQNQVDFPQMMQIFAESVGLLLSSEDVANPMAMVVTKWQVQLQDKEVQTLRDSVTQLMATGYWELAAKLIDFYGAVVDWHQEKQQQLQYVSSASSFTYPVDAHISRINSPLPPAATLAASTHSTSNSIFTFENTSGHPSSNINSSAILPPFSPVKSLLHAGGTTQLYKMAHSLAGTNGHTTGYMSPLQSPLATSRMRKGIFPPPPPNAPPMTPISQVPNTSNTSPIPPSSSVHITPIMNTHSSPKRNDMLKKELHRMQTKIQEKLKFDNFLRSPATFIALHFYSSVPNFYTLDNLRQCFDPMIVLRADAFSPKVSTSPIHTELNSASNLNDTGSGFYEQWFILKVDMACYTACMDYYRYYLQEGQLKVSDYRKTGHASYLQHPLQVTSLMQRLMTCFPEYLCLPPHYDVRQMAVPVSATPASMGTTDATAFVTPAAADMFQGILHPQEIPSILPRSAIAEDSQARPKNHDSYRLGKEMEDKRQVLKFLQIHPVYVADLVNASQENSTIFHENPHFTKSHYHDQEGNENDNHNKDNNEEEEEEDEDDLGDNTQDIIHSQDVNDLVDGPSTHTNHAKQQHIAQIVRKHLDKTHLDFTHFPTRFYVYCPHFWKQKSPQESGKKKKTTSISSMEDLFATALNRDADKEIIRVCLNVSAETLETLYPSALHDTPVSSLISQPKSNEHLVDSRLVSPNEKLKPLDSQTYYASSLLGSRRGGASVTTPTPQQILQQALTIAEARSGNEELKQDIIASKHNKNTSKNTGDVNPEDDETADEEEEKAGENDLVHVKRDLLQKLNTTALSSWNVAWQVDSLPMLAVHAGMEVLFQQAVTLARCQRMLRHVLSLKTTEIANQPEQSLLHTDNIFNYVCCFLSDLLQQPGHCIVGLLSAEHIVIMEKERHEVRWQAIRKHGKREYMRQLAQFEEQPQSQNAPNNINTSNNAGVNRKRPLRHQDTEKMRPKEPDWEALREEYDAQSGMDHVQSLSLLSQHCWRKVRRILQSLRKVVNKLQDIENTNNNSSNNSSNVQKDDIGGSARVRQLSKFSANVTILDAAEAAEQQGVSELRKVDTDLHLKQKLLLYLESLYAAAEIGIDLS